MRFLNWLLRLWAYFFHISVSVFLLGSAVVARMYHQQLNLEMLPFSLPAMVSRATMLSLIGFLCVFLALVKVFEFVFPLWSAVVVVLLLYGFLFSPYRFAGPPSLLWPGVLFVAAIFALVGSILVLMPKPRNYRRW